MPKPINTERIRTMTKLAIYDKTLSRSDRDALDYYKSDYIFKKNARNYLGIILGITFIMLLHFFNLIVVNGIFVDQVDYMAIVYDYCVNGIAILIVYTWIGIYIYGKEYDEKKSRIKAYYKVLNKLE